MTSAIESKFVLVPTKPKTKESSGSFNHGPHTGGESKSKPNINPRKGNNRQNKLKRKSKSVNVAYLISDCRLMLDVMKKEEAKEVIPAFRGADAPVILEHKHPGFRYVPTKESQVYMVLLRGLFTDKYYRLRLSLALNMSSSGAGITNSTISNSALTANTDFVALATVFNEYFIVGFRASWMPASRYQYPLGGTSTLSVANLPLGVADLQHGQAAYSSLTAMTQNYAFSFHSTGDPFTKDWVNTEDSGSTVLASETAPTQSWNNVSNSNNYQGTLQFLTQSAPPALPFSQVLGTFAVHWDVLFRVRQ